MLIASLPVCLLSTQTGSNGFLLDFPNSPLDSCHIRVLVVRFSANNKPAGAVPDPREGASMGNLFQELRRRKVFRVAAVYVVVAWFLIQGADTVLPTLRMPEWSVFGGG